jgi:hypothetical protein
MMEKREEGDPWCVLRSVEYVVDIVVIVVVEYVV